MRTSVVLALVLLCSCSDEGVTLPPIEQQPMIDAGADMMDQAQDAARDADAIPDLTQDMPADVDMRQPADMVDMPDEAPDMCASCEGKQVCDAGVCVDASSWMTWTRRFISKLDDKEYISEYAVLASNGPALFDEQRNTITITLDEQSVPFNSRRPSFNLTLKNASNLDFAFETCMKPNDDVDVSIDIWQPEQVSWWMNTTFGVDDCLAPNNKTDDGVDIWDLQIFGVFVFDDRIQGTFKAKLRSQEGHTAGEIIEVDGAIDMPIVRMSM